MKRLSTMIAFLMAASTAASAWADSAHFIRAAASVDSNTGNLVASFKEAGLGNTPITYVLTAAQESFTFQCFTRSGNKPQGEPNGVSFSNESTSTTIQPRNGQINADIKLQPQLGDADCQGGGLKLCLTAVSYQGVSLTDTTNAVTAPLSTTNFNQTLTKPICNFD